MTRSTFLSNTASGGGGGAHFESEPVTSKVTVVGTTFQGNRVGDAANIARAPVTHHVTSMSAACQGIMGGGVYFYGFGVNTNDFVNTLFAANEAIHDQGSALFSDSSGSDDVITLRHATIASPTVGSGSAVYVISGTVHITNTIISSYTTGLERAGGALTEDYNLFFGTTTPITGSVTSGGNGVLWGDPAFADPTNADYHLRLSSPAIDVGTNAGVTADFENEARPQGNGYDVGYDESPFTHVPISGLSVIHSSPTLVNSVILFTATLTTGSGVRYEWDFGDGSWRDGLSSAASHTYTLAADYTVVVTATNSLGSMRAAAPVTVTKFKIYLPILFR